LGYGDVEELDMAMVDAWSNILKVEGFLSQMNYAVWQCLFNIQEREGITGNLFEIGTWKGRSAAALTFHCRAGEQIGLCDLSLNQFSVLETLAHLGFNTEPFVPIPKKSSAMTNTELAVFEKNVRWFHIDGDHSSEMTYLDLGISDRILGDNGIVAVDDFFNPRYFSVTWGVFSYLRSHPHSLRAFLVGDNKGYFCRPHKVGLYRQHILTELPNYLRDSHLALHQSESLFDCETLGLGPSWIEGRRFVGLDTDLDFYETVVKSRYPT